jgi:hypothetical protein
MTDRDGRLEERVATLERTITDGHADEGLPDTARVDARLDDLETSVEDIEDRIAELDAAVQALRGFAGGVRAVDETIERRADAAVARVDRLETELRELRIGLDGDGAAAEGDGGRDPERDEPRTASRHGACADLGEPPSGCDRTDRDGQAGPGRPDADRHGHGGNGSLNGDVAARTDATLAEAAAMADDSGEAEADDGRSLGERIRRLL